MHNSGWLYLFNQTATPGYDDYELSYTWKVSMGESFTVKLTKHIRGKTFAVHYRKNSVGTYAF